MSLPVYEVYAIRYAHKADRLRLENIIAPIPGTDPHDSAMPMDYFVWVIIGGGRNIVVDTGYHAKVWLCWVSIRTRSPMSSSPIYIMERSYQRVLLVTLN